jgi:branched-chain amino acid transport system permease protein
MTIVIQYALDALGTGLLYALLALGISMTFGVARIVNFAQSELIMVGTYAIYVTSSAPIVLVVLAALVAPVLLALLLQRVVFRPLRGADEMTYLIASFGASLLLENAATAIASTNPLSTSFGSGLLSYVHIGSVEVTKLVLVELGIAACLLFALIFFLRRTSMGIQLRAVAADFEMAQLLGVRSNRMMMIAFGIAGLTAALAAIVLTAQSGVMTPTVGVEPIILGLVSAVIGGLESLTGAAVGGMLLGSLTVVLQVVLPQGLAPYSNGIIFVGVFAVLMARPQGLLRNPAGQERHI